MSASESNIQANIRLSAARKRARLWRNNVGVLKDSNGRPVRFGLANESPKLNAVLKSSDLIGWEPVIITPEMVGQTIARVLSVETKHEGWKFNPNDPHEVAQAAWIDLINAEGGRALFASTPNAL